ncbi:MAG: amidase [Bradyrhizobium sp.]|uniref:amidase n=1 Tax=Bradyrhizobium sp. TaxID=376 RepID=UPI001DB3855B|nr:amidase [Bradyrhizobium sp.]MBV9560371.1 amidase [Bradyrhizobium sp.]
MRHEKKVAPDALYYRDATELAHLIRTKKVSPVEVVQSHLDRIKAVNPKVNAITTLLAEQAVQSARKAEQAVANGDELGVFHGVPFSIKDVIDVAGVLTHGGSKLLADNIASTDAPSVARMKGTGAIPLSKTNVPEFSCWTETDNLVTGRTNNPWNLERTPGGSSGGESASIAAGMSPMGLGSDVAISVRGPAALTGIVGLKATHGRIPYTGHFPHFLSRYWHIGPMARSVRDVATMFEVLKGGDGIDPYAIHARDARPANAPIGGRPLRIGYLAKTGFGPVDPEVAAAVEAAAKFLDHVGHHVEIATIPLLEENDFVGTAMTLFMGELLDDFRKLVAGRKEGLHFIGTLYAEMPDPSLKDYIAAQTLMTRLKSVFADYFERHDVLLCPVIPFTAPPHQLQEYVVDGQTIPATQMMRATSPFNLTGLPGLSVPLRMSSENLPINVQLVSRWLDEDSILRLGALIESQSTVWDQRPNL